MQVAEYGFANLLNKAGKSMLLSVLCITDLILREDMVNLDFADVHYVIKNSRCVLMGTAQAKSKSTPRIMVAAAIANRCLANRR